VSLRDLFDSYHQDVQFLMVYIREAHPRDGWWLGGGLMGKAIRLYAPRANTEVNDPTTLEERRQVAGQCEDMLSYGIRTYVDELDDRVNKAYAALPTRLYLVDVEGTVAYAGGLGPYGFKPEELGSAIRQILPSGLATL
jgi:hypothetical protein